MKFLEKAKKRHCWPHTSMADAYESGFMNGADSQLEVLQGEVLHWLEVTGVLTEGTSYYSELVDGILKCPVSKEYRKTLISRSENSFNE